MCEGEGDEERGVEEDGQKDLLIHKSNNNTVLTDTCVCVCVCADADARRQMAEETAFLHREKNKTTLSEKSKKKFLLIFSLS